MQKALRLFALVVAGLTSAAAYAADVPVLKAPPYLAPAYNWTGFYVGGHAGGSWADNTFGDVIGGTEAARFTAHGYFGGGQAGYNWQTSQWVLGVELEGSLSHLRRGVFGQFCGFPQFGGIVGICGFNQFGQLGGGCFPQFGGLLCGGQLGARVQQLGLLSGRLGYARDRTLFFIKAGGAISHDKYVVNIPGVIAATPTDTRFGWLVGAGIEYGLAANWSAKIEYNYIDLGTERLTFVAPGALTFVFDQDQQVTL